MSVRAVVELKLEVRVSSAWNETTTMKQINQQARDEAVGLAEKLAAQAPEVRLLKGAQVTAVVADNRDAFELAVSKSDKPMELK
ncbi:hypothetical protein [Pseudovibrio sp. WM33]|uniref:hypothetical protein n=1 Tax=Pseudovibrio sp. WM33 TaxID=1735585 RepID=UPI0007AEA142|nr:hypothetical protein [Pseudovibrio sp. WM33]KZL26054.1 hypothetical protein PsWM33_01579 [Pseudovibrio sp. WM33]